MVLSHWVACFWGLLPQMEDKPYNWMTKYEQQLAASGATYGESWDTEQQTYCLSLYFTLCTITGATATEP